MEEIKWEPIKQKIDEGQIETAPQQTNIEPIQKINWEPINPNKNKLMPINKNQSSRNIVKNDNSWIIDFAGEDWIEEQKSKGAIEYKEAWKKLNKWEMIPYLNAKTIIDDLGIYKSMKKLEGGEKLTDQQYTNLREYITDMAEIQTRGYTMGGDLVNAGATGLSFIGEFATSLGVAGLFKKATQETTEFAVKTAVKKGVKTAVKKGIKGVVKKGVKEVAKIGAKGLAMTVVMPHRVGDAYLQRKISDGLSITDKGDAVFKESEEAPAKTLMKSIGDVWIENSSEFAGETIIKPIFTGVGRSTRVFFPKLLREGFETLSEQILKLPFTKAVSKFGYDGFLEEIGEERLADLLRTTFNLDAEQGYSLEQFGDAMFPPASQWLVELGVVGMYGSVSNTSNYLINKLKTRGVSQTKIKDIITQSSESEKAKMTQDFKIQEDFVIKDLQPETLAKINDAIGKPVEIPTEEIKITGKKAVESKAFKDWFGDSKVIDNKGEPLVVYHGTNQEFEQFRIGKGGRNEASSIGAWFTDSKNVAKKFSLVERTEDFYIDSNTGKEVKLGKFENPPKGEKLITKDISTKKIIETYLSLQNPLILESDKNRDSFEKMMDLRDEIAKPEYEVGTKWDEGGATKGSDSETSKIFRDELIKQGHDGIILKKTGFDNDKGKVSEQYVAFKSTQIEIKAQTKTAQPIKEQIKKEEVKITEKLEKPERIKKETLRKDLIEEARGENKDLNEEDLFDFLDTFESLQADLKTLPKGISLIQFIKDSGGIFDEFGDLKSRGIEKQAPFVLRKSRFNKEGKDVSIDAVGLRLFEAGFFEERPLVNDVLDAIDDELRGEKIFAGEDVGIATQREDIENQIEKMEATGVNIDKIKELKEFKELSEKEIAPLILEKEVQEIKKSLDFQEEERFVESDFTPEEIAQLQEAGAYIRADDTYNADDLFSISQRYENLTQKLTTKEIANIVEREGFETEDLKELVKTIETEIERPQSLKEYFKNKIDIKFAKEIGFETERVKKADERLTSLLEISTEEKLIEDLDDLGIMDADPLRSDEELFEEAKIIMSQADDIFVDFEKGREFQEQQAKKQQAKKTLDRLDIQTVKDIEDIEKEIGKREKETEEEIAQREKETEEEKKIRIEEELKQREKFFEQNKKKNRQIQNRKSNPSVLKTLKSNIKNFSNKGREILADIFVPFETRMYKISPKLAIKFKKYTFFTNKTIQKNLRIVDSFLQKAKKMTKNEFVDLDYTLKNRNVKKIDELIEKYNMQEDYSQVRNLLDSLYEEALAVGIDVNYLDAFFPRQVDPKLREKFLEFLQNKSLQGKLDIEEGNIDTEDAKISLILEDLKRHPNYAVMSLENKIAFINSRIRGFSTGGLLLFGTPAQLKKHREIDQLTADMNWFYKPFTQSLLNYVGGATETIEKRKLFGGENKKIIKSRTSLLRKKKRIAKLNDPLLLKEHTEKLKKEVVELKKDIEKAPTSKKIKAIESDIIQKENEIRKNINSSDLIVSKIEKIQNSISTDKEKLVDLKTQEQILRTKKARVKSDTAQLRKTMPRLTKRNFAQNRTRERIQNKITKMETEIKDLVDALNLKTKEKRTDIFESKKRIVKIEVEQNTLETKKIDLKNQLQDLKKNLKKQPQLEDIKKTETKIKLKEKQIKNLTSKEFIKQKTKEVESEIKPLQDFINDFYKEAENHVEESVGMLVKDMIENGVIYAKDERIVRKLVSARFNDQPVGDGWGLFRDLGYLGTLNDIGNAITQIGDLSLSSYKTGLLNTIIAGNKIRKGKAEISLEDLGIQEMAEEFKDTRGLTKLLKWVFNKSGLSAVDGFGKNTISDSELINLRKQAKTNNNDLNEKLDLFFPQKKAQIKQDLIDGKITDDITFLTYDAVSQLQPISKDQMPITYFKGGFYKSAYMLKTYSVKLLDLVLNDIFKNIADINNPKNVIKGLRNFVKLQTMMFLFGIPKDKLMDFVLGRETELEDLIANNIMIFQIFNKYNLTLAKRRGVGEVAKNFLLPPTFDMLSQVSKDVYDGIVKDKDIKDMRSIAFIPLGGRIYYYRTKEKKKRRTR